MIKAVQRAYETGHFWSDMNPDGPNVKPEDIAILDPKKDEVARLAIESMTRGNVLYLDEVYKAHKREPHYDGIPGPAINKFVDLPRCHVPDFAPPPGVRFSFSDPATQEVAQQMQNDYFLEAVGVGNWKRCHGVGDFHKAIVEVDLRNMPLHLSKDGIFKEVLMHVQKAYADVGLLFVFVADGVDLLTGGNVAGTPNIDFSFVTSSDGWIGLAIVGQGQNCGSRIWCRYLASYKGGSTRESIIDQWVSLILHELAHNCGRGHTAGGHSNPSILTGLPRFWYPSDPTTPWMKAQFGGIPVNGQPPQPPPTTIEERIATLEKHNQEMKNFLNQMAAQVTVNTYIIKKLMEKP